MTRLRSVLFDLDGTLLDTAQDMAYALNLLRQKHALSDLPFHDVREKVSHGARALVSLGFQIAESDPIFKEHVNDFLSYYEQHASSTTRPFHGMEHVLTFLDDNKIPWGIVTNKPSRFTLNILNALHLDQRTTCVVSGDTLAKRKPDPDPILHACHLLNQEVENCVYVGDSLVDVKAAHAAGMPCLVALYGYIEKKEDPLSWQADAYIHNAEEIITWLKEHPIPDNEKAILKISGINADKFLQGQLTIDINTLTPKKYLLAAHCNPQGRIVSLFYITFYDNGYYLIFPKNMLEIATNQLKKYAVFFKITLTQVNEIPFSQPPPSKKEDMQNGVPAIYPETSAMFLPHELNLPNLNAVSFDKGCYTGQEIIARMHYRGKLKKGLYRASIKTSATLKAGDELYATISNKPEIAATIIDSLVEKADNYHILLMCDELHAINNHLYLAEGTQEYVTFRS